ncbi:MAG: ABC transporter permease [Promethearchaeota archaeon]
MLVRDDLTNYTGAHAELKLEHIDAIIVIDENFSEAIIGNTWWYKLVKDVPPDQVANITRDLSPENKAMLEAVAGQDLPSGGPELNITVVPDQVTEAIISQVFSQLVNDITLGYNNASSPIVNTHQESKTVRITPFDYIAPGLVIAGVLVCLSQLSGHFAEEKELGTMRRLATTPVARRDILLSGLLSQMVVAAVQTTLLLLLLYIFGAYFNPGANLLVLFAIPMLFACKPPRRFSSPLAYPLKKQRLKRE